jgi:hypothetical protein
LETFSISIALMPLMKTLQRPVCLSIYHSCFGLRMSCTSANFVVGSLDATLFMLSMNSMMSPSTELSIYIEVVSPAVHTG